MPLKRICIFAEEKLDIRRNEIIRNSNCFLYEDSWEHHLGSVWRSGNGSGIFLHWSLADDNDHWHTFWQAALHPRLHFGDGEGYIK